jgi:uncharacterized coiled-coil DUF342 family protein
MDYQEAIENYNWLEVEFEKLKDENEALKARLAELAQESKPVAWVWQSDNYATRFSQRIFELFDEADDMRNRHGGNLYPLYFEASPNAKRIAELEQELEIQNKIDVLRKIVLEKP